jgi:cellulose biosynthesis protein BcsQ/tetratricopeptide (TPR) repeat protein
MPTTDTPLGQIVTFYSFKGGTGRSMALANVAWILAANGKRVLVADWDLESPGLHRFFKPFLDADRVRNSKGIIDLIHTYEDEARKGRERPGDWHRAYTHIQDLVLPLRWTFESGGSLDFLCAGLQNPDYSLALSSMDWNVFYDNLGGADFFKALRRTMKEQYDFTLVDSRTGLNDVAEICTMHLPDTLVTCFTLSDQGIEGAAEVAKRVNGQRLLHPIRVLPVPMRVDQAEKEKRDAGRSFARSAFGDLPSDLIPPDRDRFWGAVEVPYEAFYAYEETLATFGDVPGSTRTLLSAYVTLTDQITHGAVTAFPAMPEADRLRVQEQYKRQPPPIASEIVLQFAVRDQAWAEWIERVLVTAGVKVADRRPAEVKPLVPEELTAEQQVLTVVSPWLPRHLLETRNQRGKAIPRLSVHVSPVGITQSWGRGLVNLGAIDPAQADEAVAALRSLLGRQQISGVENPANTVPYPRREPRWSKLPPRNTEFAGRAGVMWKLREKLRSDHNVVALIGMGGIGKTQVAVEYAYRFRSSYQLVWWIDAENLGSSEATPGSREANLGSVEASFADLAEAVGIPRQAERAKTMSSTLEALRRGIPTREWLIVLDNVGEPDEVAAVLARQVPGVPGHILVTTRSTAWGDERFKSYQAITVPVFHRVESTTRLRQQVQTLSDQDADQVADRLGDLPLAIDSAIGSLRGNDVVVQEYLAALASSLSTSVGTGASKEERRQAELAMRLKATFSLNLERLRNQSPAAYHLLEILSVMAPSVHQDFVFGDAMAEALAPLDPSVSDPNMRQPVLQWLERSSLVGIDTRDHLVQMHRLLQEFVREQMTENERQTARDRVHLVLAKGRPKEDVNQTKQWPAYRLLWPHLAASRADLCLEPTVRQLLADRVRYLWLRGDWSQAESLGNQVAEYWQAKLDGQDETLDRQELERQLLWLRHNLGNVLRDTSRFTEAYELDRRTLARLTDLLGADHSQTLLTAGSYAADLRALGRYGESLDREQETRALWLNKFGERYPLAVTAANNLTVALRAVGKFVEARELDEELHRRLVGVYGPDDPRTLWTANALGRDLREGGEYQASVDWLRVVLAMYGKLSEPQHKGRLIAQANLAASLRSAGLVGEAADLLGEAYAQLQEFFGPDRPETLACRLNRAINLLIQGQVEEAVTELQETVKAYKETLHDRHPVTLVAKNNLAAGLRAAGDYEAAVNLATQTVEGFRSSLKESHPHTLASEMNLAICLDDLGNSGHAIDQMKRAKKELAKILAPEHPDRLLAEISLGIVGTPLASRGRIPVVRAPLEALTVRLGENHSTIRDLQSGKLVPRLIDPSDPF